MICLLSKTGNNVDGRDCTRGSFYRRGSKASDHTPAPDSLARHWRPFRILSHLPFPGTYPAIPPRQSSFLSTQAFAQPNFMLLVLACLCLCLRSCPRLEHSSLQVRWLNIQGHGHVTVASFINHFPPCWFLPSTAHIFIIAGTPIQCFLCCGKCCHKVRFSRTTTPTYIPCHMLFFQCDSGSPLQTGEVWEDMCHLDMCHFYRDKYLDSLSFLWHMISSSCPPIHHSLPKF